MKKLFTTIVILLLPLLLLGITPQSRMVKVAFAFQTNDEDIEDQEIFMEVYTTLMAVEKIASLVDVKLTVMSDEVKDDVFIFSIKTQSQKDLAIKLIDEEGLEVGNNLFTIVAGSNYRTINTSSLRDGTYVFRLTDAEGNEEEEAFTINRK